MPNEEQLQEMSVSFHSFTKERATMVVPERTIIVLGVPLHPAMTLTNFWEIAVLLENQYVAGHATAQGHTNAAIIKSFQNIESAVDLDQLLNVAVFATTQVVTSVALVKSLQETIVHAVESATTQQVTSAVVIKSFQDLVDVAA
jgi:hypothetical protein